MITMEKVIAEMEKLPMPYLEEIYNIIKGFKKDDVEDNLMARLRKIKISAPSDFSIKADLYNIEEDSVA